MAKPKSAELREIWRVRIADYRSSGLSGAGWCASHQIKEHQLWYWANKFRSEPVPESAPRFVAVQVHEPMRGKERPLLVRIGSAVIEVSVGYDSELLCDVARTLATLC